VSNGRRYITYIRGTSPQVLVKEEKEKVVMPPRGLLESSDKSSDSEHKYRR